MKSKLFVLIISIFLPFTFGCGKESSGVVKYHHTKWEVDQIHYGDEIFSYYRLTPINPGRVNAGTTWMLDTIGKFIVGDTLVFSKINK